MSRHACLPTSKKTEKGCISVSNVIDDIVEALGITLRPATMKFAQTIRVFEEPHSRVQTILKMSTGEFGYQWHKFLPVAILNHNTTYLMDIGCELKPSRILHGWVPHNILHHKL